MEISSTIEKIGSFISQNLKSFYKFETITPWQKYDILSSASEARTLRLESSNLISSDVSWFCFCKSASWSRIPSETTMVKSKRVPSRWISPLISTKSKVEMSFFYPDTIQSLKGKPETTVGDTVIYVNELVNAP